MTPTIYKKKRGRFAVVLLTCAILLFLTSAAKAYATGTPDTTTETLPGSETVTTETGTADDAPAGTIENLVRTLFGESTETVDIIILLTVLTLLPSLIIMLTGFTRIVIVLSFIRNAMGTQQAPPNQIIIGLALFLTLFVMSPVITQVYDEAYVPYTNEEITQTEFLSRAMEPTREFMLKQVMQSDLDFFATVAGEEYSEPSDVSNFVLIPAFITSEIKHAFEIGFFLYIPFIVIDMVVSSTLMAMGMMMLPPAMISMPFKIMLFVFVDGWQLVISMLLQGFN